MSLEAKIFEASQALFDKWQNAKRREIFSDSLRAAASGGCSLDAPAGAVANQGKFSQAG